MIRKIILLLSCILLIGCAEEKKVEIPETVFSKQKMVEVMVDIHLLEASLNLNMYNADRTNPNRPSTTFNVYKKHHITKSQYDESFNYYSQHPELLTEIYQQVLEELSTLQAEVLSEKDDANDSIFAADSSNLTLHKKETKGPLKRVIQDLPNSPE